MSGVEASPLIFPVKGMTRARFFPPRVQGRWYRQSAQGVTPPPAPTLSVHEVSPDPYVTQDPYRLPYRDHGNWSTGEPVRAKKYPRFTKSYVLRSNSTAVRVNVTEAPLVIDLTFSPQFTNPDHTGIGGGTNEDGSVRSGTSTNSFVYSTAVVTVHNEGSRSIVEQGGFGQGFNMDLEQKITIYREGKYVVTLTGNLIDVKMAITTGAGADKPPVSQAANSGPSQEEAWG